MARVVDNTRTIPVGRKNPYYPLNVPVQVMFSNWVRHKEGIITKELDMNGDIYWFTITGGPARGKKYSLLAVPPLEVLVDGEAWDCNIRA